MLFHSQAFILVFLPLCLGGFFLCGRIAGPVWTIRWLIAASLIFYGWWDPRFLPLLAGSILVNHALARAIGAARRGGDDGAARRLLTRGITINLLVLGLFKYADFLASLLPGVAPPGIALPLAISFFTFQQIMILADAHRNPTDDTSLLHRAAFGSFFPHLIAGPLVRPNEIVPQLRAPGLGRPDADNLTAGLAIFLLGLGKKLVLADLFGGFADTGFNAAEHGASLTFFEAWYATLAYALQIYFDFSAYSDMAIGLARMFNVRFPLNFDSPYQARSIAGFWRCWHITLGQFLRDFVYIPLGGNRAGAARTAINLLATMLLCGLWHGAAWRFVLWGGLHGVYLVAGAGFRRVGGRLPGSLAHGLTLLAVVVAWVPFRAADLSTAGSMLAGMAGLHGVALPAMIAGALPAAGWPRLGQIVTAVPVLPFLGDARTLSFPEVTACLLLGWCIVLGLPHVHAMTERGRYWALTGGFAFTVQALFFAPRVAPFLYFRF